MPFGVIFELFETLSRGGQEVFKKIWGRCSRHSYLDVKFEQIQKTYSLGQIAIESSLEAFEQSAKGTERHVLLL